ncbi:MAG: GtrA family protein [Lachnospiraceae bacterium]|jgi:putative flippase GtrA|nr:GtrA family protein [Lachnospiraceae bacterium]
MKKLISQILKFGVVGVIAFFIDFFLFKLFTWLGIPYLIANVMSFTISLVCNYLMSMKFVFTRRENISRGREFVLFAILSVIGLLIQEFILWLVIEVIWPAWPWLNGWLKTPDSIETFTKLGATGIVMVYNFITRKMLLDRKDVPETETDGTAGAAAADGERHGD